MNLKDHPLELINELEIPENSTLELSIYSYSPNALEDKRRTILVRKKDLTKSYFNKLKLDLLPKEEIALNSRVYVPNKLIGHIPMIDFKGDNPHAVAEVLKEYDFPFALFHSGRSYHGYGLKLIDNLPFFLGTLLLANLGQEIVDSRWVGHRLRTEYASLRWTANDKHYKAPPTFHGFLSKDFESTSILSYDAQLKG